MTTVIPEGLTFDEYHPSMAPIFESIARRAVSDGRSYEYNEMASRLGFPDLDALSISAEKRYTWEVEVEVTRTVTVSVSATGTSEEEAWEAINESDVEEALDSDGIEYDSTDPNWGSYSLYDEEEI
jgi:hypothetical protein